MKHYLDVSRMDVERYLQDQGIEYRVGGERNVKSGFVGVCCPFCPNTHYGPDYGFHLGINLESKIITCWRCKTKGPITRYIKEVEQISFARAERIAQQYFILEVGATYLPAKFTPDFSKKVLKDTFREELLPVTRQYLISRGFDPDYLVRKYDIMDGGHIGREAWRVIIPIIMFGQVVSYYARSISPDEETRYLACPDEMAIIPRNHLLYNYDTVSSKMIVVEGPTDVWRMGDSCVATMGTIVSPYQIELIQRKKVKSAFVLFDPKAEMIAESLASAYKMFVPHVEVVYLDDGDPGSLSDEEAAYLRKDLVGY